MKKEDSYTSEISGIKQINEDIDIENSNEHSNDKINNQLEFINEVSSNDNIIFENDVDDDNKKETEYSKIDNYIGEYIKDNNISIIKGFVNEKKIDRIFYTKIKVKNIDIKANLLIIHGYGNSNQFIEIGCKLAKEGYLIHLYDIRGFGYSGGIKFNSTIKDNFDDLLMILKIINNNYSLFVMTYDFSCNLLMQFMILNNINFSGVIYISPILIPNYYYGNIYKYFKRKSISLFSKIVDDILITNFYNSGYLSKNISNIKENKINFYIPYLGISFISFILESGEFIINNSNQLINPTLLFFGKKNKLTPKNNILYVFNNMSSCDKIAKLIKNGYHEIHNDYEKEDLFKEILKWLNKRYKTSTKFNIFQIKKLNYNRKKSKILNKILKLLLIILYFKILF